MQQLVDHFCGQGDRENKRVFLEYTLPLKGSLLDLGCGNGEFTAKVAEKANAEVMYGIELSETKALAAKRQGVRVNVGNLNNKIPFGDEFFDTISANQIIEHLVDTDTFIEEAKRVLKRNGQLVISTTNLAALHYRIQLLFGQLPICLHPANVQFGNFLKGEKNPVHGHKSVFTHTAFLEFLEFHGFTIQQSSTVSLYPFSPKIGRILGKVFPSIGAFSTVRVRKKHS
ncbi:MAG: hypothetical protein A2900_03300 [Candidatus Chisholmbacteria bacterium RIFCSPLOWO2_01_FULL_50_28]|uniref:Methyltransferase type 11 domain-containing protein n=1 Tax=Candidatus Chisholmbacteria bacterium RIFCSPHIGHO2_01_FULL_52_32 TaxID=1797591 RepID=A0A1G1VSZ7_9BACT|nr:MAG: hypothetical protein A2786_03445 [Candidatus Chisholmbacteria bacterium RIFCSPHIGHO2_01_FULL_52_32]OGY20103.1 MAG: hypothetical protein A2900_03300 [Candidatus Chisholmbacteria bacterium RIFCSPLOWO2_01_FULL_50_28]